MKLRAKFPFPTLWTNSFFSGKNKNLSRPPSGWPDGSVKKNRPKCFQTKFKHNFYLRKRPQKWPIGRYFCNSINTHRSPGGVAYIFVIASTSRTEDLWFVSRQGVSCLVLETLQCSCPNLCNMHCHCVYLRKIYAFKIFFKLPKENYHPHWA
jgi:hypothetical protein